MRVIQVYVHEEPSNGHMSGRESTLSAYISMKMNMNIPRPNDMIGLQKAKKSLADQLVKKLVHHHEMTEGLYEFRKLLRTCTKPEDYHTVMQEFDKLIDNVTFKAELT